MTVKRMDNVGIVVENIDAAIEFFTELGLTLEGRMPIEGGWAGRVTGVRGQRVEIAMMRTPDGHSRLELSRFDAPAIAFDHRTAPVNSLGYLRVMFTVEDMDDTLARLSKLGATVVDEVVNYEGIGSQSSWGCPCVHYRIGSRGAGPLLELRGRCCLLRIGILVLCWKSRDSWRGI